MTLNVGIVARTLNADHLRGTGRYVQELLNNTQREDQIEWTAYAQDASKPFRVPASLIGTTDVFDYPGDRLYLWEQVGLPSRWKRAGLDLVHCAENTVPLWQPVPTIVTIHDTVLWEEKRPSKMDHFYFHAVQGNAYRNCAAVITISESSRRDIAARWPFLEKRISVIPHGISDDFFEDKKVPLPKVLKDSLGGAPYLLYLGGPQERKRFSWALNLLAACGREDIHLIACGFGSGGAKPVLQDTLRHRVHFAPFVDDSELVTLYRNALAAIYPTLYEGFGFPAVEAQAAGTPILFSPVSSLVDLVGPLTWPVETQDFGAWVAALKEILALSPSARGQIAAEGVLWARQFSWRKSVERHFGVYDAVRRAAKRR
ncbi:glycosyltransferase family 4 protein [Massilia yuzhufengensis]|uniref:Glycosyltransferase involved in cell wall bisynthesis n=1 Tax=Massilia yuzhufengensis TaxID=1164594 RepID=A0A1I1DPD1_9BURK|nr:glycosyltransferase family 1 protein [Massilia yuzhufengensis]SFB74908.1 Glycosyltransferase involved in cell wall bisynthesis [Massilia yuzhufengensis]